jgi:hypothetical protein
MVVIRVVPAIVLGIEFLVSLVSETASTVVHVLAMIVFIFLIVANVIDTVTVATKPVG